jgi:hypothetical protein
MDYIDCGFVSKQQLRSLGRLKRKGKKIKEN